MRKQTERERFVRRYFEKKGIDIDQHPNITGIIFEGDRMRVIGFLSEGDFADYVDGKLIPHPVNAGVFYKLEGISPLYSEPERGVGRITCMMPSEALHASQLDYLDPYNLLDMLERAEEVGLTEFSPTCEMYFVNRNVEGEN